MEYNLVSYWKPWMSKFKVDYSDLIFTIQVILFKIYLTSKFNLKSSRSLKIEQLYWRSSTKKTSLFMDLLNYLIHNMCWTKGPTLQNIWYFLNADERRSVSVHCIKSSLKPLETKLLHNKAFVTKLVKNIFLLCRMLSTTCYK